MQQMILKKTNKLVKFSVRNENMKSKGTKGKDKQEKED